MANAPIGRSATIAVLFCAAALSAFARADVITWTAGGPGNSWSTPGNWSNGVGPAATDTALFDSAGAVFLPGEVTNSLDDDRTVAGLAYNNSGTFHTTDLNGHTLDVLGSLNFNTNRNAQSTTTIRDGILAVSDAVGSVNVARSFGSGASASVNLTGLSQFSATVSQFHVGTSIGGNASGELTLAHDNVIHADQVVVGDDGNGHLHLGHTNQVLAGNFAVARDVSSSTVDIVNGGTLALGTPDERTLLSIADQNTNTMGAFSGRIDMTGGTLEAYLDGLIVGRKFGGQGSATGELLGGTGHVTIGSAGNTANVIVGQSVNGGTVRGTVDFSGMQSLNANVNQLIVGQNIVGTAFGTLNLAANNDIDAHSIIIGDNGNAEMRLGQTNTIKAAELIVGKDFSSARVDITNGGSLSLGTPEHRTLLSIADQDTNTNSSLNARVDLTGGTLEAHLDGLIVGRKFGGPGSTTGELIGGAGHMTIGDEGNTANVIVGQSVNGGTVRGTVDLSGMQSLNANLNQLIVGQNISGTAFATMNLPTENYIDAHSIFVGDAASATLRLGQYNTVVADSLVVANVSANARVEVPLGASLYLGTPARHTNLSIGVFDSNTNSSMSGEMDLTSAKFVAHLGDVLIGERTGGGAGVGTGVLSIGSHPENKVTAESITLGVGVGQGTLNFQGGSLSADTIERGTGVAAFNWLGGKLGVGTFGSPARTFDLNNQGSGTLAPGESPGGTDVFGIYRQGSAATYQAELGGTTPITQYDQVKVSSQAQLAGALDIQLYNGFSPASGDSFAVLKAGSIAGQFSNAPAGASSLVTPFGSFDVSYAANQVTLSNFIADPLAAAASIGFLNGHANDVLGGSGLPGGVDAAFLNNERGILTAQFDVVDGLDLADLIESGVLDFTEPNFVLPAGQLQVWDLSFNGDAIGPGGLSLVFGYDDTGMTLAFEAALDIYHFDSGAWLPLGGIVDTLANTISVVTPSLSPFALGAPVPEPSTLALAGTSLFGFGFYGARSFRGRSRSPS
ncbi:MAG: beta strand repeat-containing protein [Pirellulales bacterium]